MNSELQSCLTKVYELYKILEEENSMLKVEVLKAQICVLHAKMEQLKAENNDMKINK